MLKTYNNIFIYFSLLKVFFIIPVFSIFECLNMNDYFLYADDLKKKYKCYGHFYDLKFSSNNIVNCRSVLEIIDSSISINDINSLLLEFRI